MSDNSFWRKQNQDSALIFGLFLVGSAIWLAQPTFTTKTSLTEIKALLDTAYINVVTVSSTSGGYVHYTSKSQKSTLAFTLKNCNKTFSISENIGDNFFDGNYDDILNGLEESHQVTVWVKTDDTASFNPNVYQIFGDDNPLLALETVRNKDLGISIYILVLGLMCLTLWFWSKSPDKFKKLFGLKKNVQ